MSDCAGLWLKLQHDRKLRSAICPAGFFIGILRLLAGLSCAALLAGARQRNESAPTDLCRLEKKHLDWLITSRSPVQVWHLQPQQPAQPRAAAGFLLENAMSVKDDILALSDTDLNDLFVQWLARLVPASLRAWILAAFKSLSNSDKRKLLEEEPSALKEQEQREADILAATNAITEAIQNRDFLSETIIRKVGTLRSLVRAQVRGIPITFFAEMSPERQAEVADKALAMLGGATAQRNAMQAVQAANASVLAGLSAQAAASSDEQEQAALASAISLLTQTNGRIGDMVTNYGQVIDEASTMIAGYQSAMTPAP